MKKQLLFLSLLVLVSCGTSTNGSSVFSSSILKTSSSSSSSSLSSGNTSSNSSSSSSSSSYSSSSGSSSIDKIEELSIDEVRNLCLKLPKPTSENESKFVQGEKVVKIKGHALSHCVTGTTKKGYGPDGKILFVDSTNYIYISSSSKENFYQQASKYINKDTSQYEITGYIAMSRGEPELVLKEYTWNSSLNIDYDLNDFALKVSSIKDIYTIGKEMDYNLKGNHNSGFISISGIKCLAKTNDNKWTFIDKNQDIISVLDNASNTTYAVGTTYDIIGSLSMKEYSLAVITGSYKRSSLEVNVDLTKISKTYSPTEINKLSSPKEDTYSRVSDELIYSYSKIIKVSAYVNYYIENNRYYFTLSEDNNLRSSKNDASLKDDVLIQNKSMRNITYDEATLYAPLKCKEGKQEVFVIRYSNTKINKKMIWSIYVLEDYIKSSDE